MHGFASTESFVVEFSRMLVGTILWLKDVAAVDAPGNSRWPLQARNLGSLAATLTSREEDGFVARGD